MKELGRSNDTRIVELSEEEFSALVRIAGNKYGHAGDLFEANIGPALQKLSLTRLGALVDMLRDAANDLEQATEIERKSVIPNGFITCQKMSKTMLEDLIDVRFSEDEKRAIVGNKYCYDLRGYLYHQVGVLVNKKGADLWLSGKDVEMLC